MKQIQHTALRKKVSCYHYLIKSSDNLKPFLQLFNNRSKNSVTVQRLAGHEKTDGVD